MNSKLLLVAAIALAMQPARGDDAPAAVPSSPTAEPVIPTADFPVSHYEALWKKSPFSVATPDGPAESSPDTRRVSFRTRDRTSW